jgi:asparagine synthase (glutamine-hydrolysing)
VFDGILHFGSEIKALRGSPAFDATLAHNWLEPYLALGYIVAPETVYRHVRKLEPGHWLLASGNRFQIQQYWDVPQFDTDGRSEQEILDDIDAHLRAAVSQRLESEVPLGAFLSGGIDSGLVVSYMAEETAVPPITVSVGFADEGSNELTDAGQTARWLGTRHYEHLLSPDLADIVPLVAGAFDEPFADASAVPTYEVCRTARQHVTVALSGDGGDETFAGYDFRYVPHAVEGRARRVIPSIANRPLRWLASNWPRSRRLPRPLRLGSVLDNLSVEAADAYFADLMFLKPRDLATVCGRPELADVRTSSSYAVVTDPYRRCPSADPVQRAEYADLKVYMPNGPLVKVDRMSMLNSLEVRCPLLDSRVVELAFRVPAHMKLKGSCGKRLLRELAKRRLPAEIAAAPKRGFNAPAGSWTSSEGAGLFESEVLANSAPLASSVDLAACRRLFAAHVNGEHLRPHLFWALWMASRWLADSSSELTSARQAS